MRVWPTDIPFMAVMMVWIGISIGTMIGALFGQTYGAVPALVLGFVLWFVGPTLNIFIGPGSLTDKK